MTNLKNAMKNFINPFRGAPIKKGEPLMQTKKRKALLGAQLSPLAMKIGILIGTIVMGYVVINLSGQQEESKLAMASDELVEIHSAALLYSAKATDFSSGFAAINADTLAPWIRGNLELDIVTAGPGDDSFLCSATPYGCKIKYWITTDATDDTYGIYVDASTAFTDTNLMKQYEISAHKGMKRVSGNVILDGDATASTASAAAGAAANNDDDGKFHFHGLY